MRVTTNSFSRAKKLLARAKTKFRDLNFDQSLYLRPRSRLSSLLVFLFYISLNVSVTSLEDQSSLRDSSPRSRVESPVKLLGHRGIFIEASARENQFSTDRRRFQTRLEDSRRISLSSRNDSRPLSNRNYRSNSR